jgi:hypothetical protein
MFDPKAGLLLVYVFQALSLEYTIHSWFPSSSVAFLAIPNLVDVAQFFIILSIGLSLCCVVMGFNGDVDEELSKLQYNPDTSQLYAPSPQLMI